MGQFDLDKYFRSRIKNHSDEIDTDALWKGLDLEEEGKDRGLVFWIVGLMTILLIGGIAFFYLSNNDTPETSVSIATRVEKLEENLNATTRKLETIIAESAISDAKKMDSPQNIQLEKITNTTEIIDEKPNTIAVENNNKNDLRSTYVENSKTTIKQNTALDPTTQTAPNLILPVEVSENKILKTPFTNSEKIEDQKHSIKPTAQIASIAPLKMRTVSSLNESSQIPSLLSNQIKPLKVKRSRMSLNVYSGYSFLQRDLKNNLFPNEIDPLITARNNSESMLKATRLGAEFRYQLRSGLYAKLGIEYQNINEKFTWQSQRIDTVNIDDAVVARYVSAQNDTTNTYGARLGTKTTDQNWISYNNHRLFNIPVSLGYEINRGPWSFFAEGSFHFNALHNFSGEQLDESLSVNSEIKYSRPKQNYSLSAGVGYQMTSHLNLYVQPHYQSLTISLPMGNAKVDQKYKLYGLKLGVGYSFN